MLKSRFLLLIVFTALAFTGCAKRGTITGGPLDTIPPVILRSSPANMSTNFTGNKIRIDFSEYIKIKDVNKQLIISPPMKTQPEIVPTGSSSKYITIKIKDTLQPNTTYSFNFGQSITDNNEGNPYSQFKFIFSTGTYIDSLTLNGSIKDAYNKKPDNFVTVMLYEANETFNDSTVYKERPRYVTNTLDSLVNYSLQNLKSGQYHLIALKDINNNYRFDPKVDKIAFLNQTITVPTDTVYQLDLFKEKRPDRSLKPAQISSNRLIAAYEGSPRGVKVTVKNGQETINTIVTQFPKKDSLQVWLPRNIKADSLQVAVGRDGDMKDFSVKMKEMKAIDTLSVTAVQKGGLHFREKFTLNTSTPLVNIDQSKIRLINKDSVSVPFTAVYTDLEQKLEFDFTKEEEQRYTFTMLPGALKDFYDKENDTLTYKLTTRTYGDYGNLRVTLQNVNRFPVLLELIDSKDEVKGTFYSEKETQVNFDAILPDTYTLRVIYDDNKNKEWDTGDYLEKRQPEEMIYLSEEFTIRANWDWDQTFNLGG
ncbi:MAG: hypothetical protein EOO45_22310 [Flavobacterium sp.]|nr:MAG: hypothetical protein EOO45_22310 [Flavobacterium sp.]